MTDKLEALSQPDYTRYDCGSCGHETLYVQHKNICPVCSHRPMSETHLYSQEYVTALIQRAEAAELREKETSARAAQADLWAKALVELDEKMKEAARILKSGERLALSRAIKILEGQDDD